MLNVAVPGREAGEHIGRVEGLNSTVGVRTNAWYTASAPW